MRVDNRAEDRGRSGARQCVRSLQSRTGMDGDAYRGPQHRRRSSKTKAPPPPPVLHDPSAPPGVPVSSHTAMEQQENLLEQELLLTVVLPEGLEKTALVHGSKPMMDLLVMLCAKYHLNPSSHTIELVSTNKNHIKFKPNALIGALEAEKVLLKPKGIDDKNKKTGPQMPEATVRMVINYKKTQKTILRVNPRIPLQQLLPAISEKCEFEPHNTVLLRSVNSDEPLDLSSSLNDLGIREVYARDNRVISPESLPPSPSHSADIIQPGKDKLQKEKENKGLFGLFKRGSKKKPERASTVSAPASPVHRKTRPVSMSSLSMPSPTYDSNTMPSDTPKKRRAPLPPRMMSLVADSDPKLQNSTDQTSSESDGNQVTKALVRGSSSESSLKRSKRKAPPPPTSPNSIAPDEDSQDRAVTGKQSALEEIQEKEETPMATEDPAAPICSRPESPSPTQENLEDDGSLNFSANISMDSGTARTASPSQDSVMDSTVPPGACSEDAPCDLTTDGKPVAHLNGEQLETDTNMRTADKAGCEEQTEAATMPAESFTAMKEESFVPQGESSQSPASSHLSAVTHTQRAEPQAPPRPGPAAALGYSEQHGAPAVASVNHTNVEIQTKLWCENTKLSPDLPLEQSSSLPSPPEASKRDMGTSAEELSIPKGQPESTHGPDSQSPTQTHTSENQTAAQTDAPDRRTSTQTHTLDCKMSAHRLDSESQTSIHIPPVTKAGSLQYVTDSEPKPKPSNELTREYIPKVGMTTYTIVPQRSLDKLRFFEVELTLEAAGVPGAQEERMEKDHLSGSHYSTPSTANRTTTDNVFVSELSRSSPVSPASPMADDVSFMADRAGSEVKDKKVPPATRPKPASFRLPQHKRTPGSYVSSAAVRSMSVGDSSNSTETLGSQRRVSSPEAMQESFFLSLSPIQGKEEQETAEVKDAATLSPPPKQEEQKSPVQVLSPNEVSSCPVPPRQMSLHYREPTAGLTLEKLRSFAAPKPYSSLTPSRFAQAVSSAVRRSQSLSHSPMGQSTRKVPLALTKRSTIAESPDLPEAPTATDMDSGHKQKKGPQTPPVSCSDPEQDVSHSEVERMWKNGTTDVSSGSTEPPVTWTTLQYHETSATLKSLPGVAQYQEE